MSYTIDVFNELYTSPESFDSTSSNHERLLYFKNAVELVYSLIIHFDDDRDLTNDKYIKQDPNYNVNLPKAEWKYYKNLYGEYTPYDKMIYIRSLDTMELIEFTKETLVEHATTRKMLIEDYDTRLDFERKHIGNRTLIAGILTPIHPDISTKAADGQIIGYAKHLVEFNEYTLIEDLNKSINRHRLRWYNAQYLHADELYTSAYYAVMYPSLVSQVILLREDRCHTLEVHSFHVTQYLASHGQLDRYMDRLTHYQKLWLYRNIRNIKKFRGHNKSFKKLVTNLFEYSNIPLLKVDLGVVPTSKALKEVRLPERHLTDTKNKTTVNELTLDQYRVIEAPVVHNKERLRRFPMTNIRNSYLGRGSTKMLNSTVSNISDLELYTKLDFAHDHWLWLSFTNRYRAFIDVEDIENSETHQITCKQAYILTRFLFAKITKQPFAMNRPEIVQYVDHIDYEPYTKMGNPIIIRRLVDQVNSFLVKIPVVLSTINFGNLVTRIYEGFTAIQNMIGSETNDLIKSSIQAMSSDIYSSPNLDFNLTQDEINNPINTVETSTYEDLVKLYIKVILDSTDHKETAVNLKEIQESSVGITRQLSSYGIMVAAKTNEIDAMLLNNTTGVPLSTRTTIQHKETPILSTEEYHSTSNYSDLRSFEATGDTLTITDTTTYSIDLEIELVLSNEETKHLLYYIDGE
jgi:hypothetical protein